MTDKLKPSGLAQQDFAQHYCGARVTLYYSGGGGISDTGRVLHIDNHWIELAKDSGERLLVPIQSLRIVKLVEAGADPAAATLLRAAEKEDLPVIWGPSGHADEPGG